MSNMNTLGQRGAINILLVPLILVVVLFIAASSFGIWAFASRADYKNNSDQKVAAAVEAAKTATQQEDAVLYDEKAKQPYDTFIGSAAYGNLTVNYPKTWSAYVEEKERGTKPINGYFQPSVVPDTSETNNSYALRIELVQQSYDQVVKSFDGQLKAGLVTVQPFKLAKVPSVVGVRVEGQITNRKQGTMIVLPLRNMTLKVWTESNDYKADLDTHILPNMSFVP